jgi:hypothetical protein
MVSERATFKFLSIEEESTTAIYLKISSSTILTMRLLRKNLRTQKKCTKCDWKEAATNLSTIRDSQMLVFQNSG